MNVRRANEPERQHPCLEQDPVGTHGVLTSDEIEYFATHHEMIVPFNARNLKPAGYELTLGKDYAIGGRLGELYPEPEKDRLVIPPFEVGL
jgi:hypothetical protein